MEVKVCTWKICSGRFSEYILKRLENDKKNFNLKNVEITESPCMWWCKSWPNIIIQDEKITNMNPLKANNILFKKLKEQKNANK